MSDERKIEVDVDVERGIQINGVTYYPLTGGPKLNPCAGKKDNDSCGPGCVCRGGQCYYTTFQLQQMGVRIPL